MSPWLTSSEEWLVRSSLAGGMLLLLGVGLMLLTKQPARRQRLGELALGCSLLVALLCALPSWAPWTLPIWSEPATPGKCVEPSRDKAEDFIVLEEPHKLLAMSDRSRGPLLSGERSDTAGVVITRDEPAKETNLAIAAAAFTREEPPASETRASTGWTLTGVWTAVVPWLVTGYVLLMATLFCRFVLGHIGLRRLWGSSEPPPPHVHALLAELTWDWRRLPRIGVSTRITLPVSFGLWRPTILIPWSFCKPNRRADLRQVLVHELTHLERLDAWSCLLVALGQAIYYHLPWYWWVRKQVRLCQEYVADAAAAALSSSEDYAEYLVSLSGYAAPRLPVGAKVMGVKGTTSDLFRRVTMLLNASRAVENRPPRWWSLLTAGTFLAIGVLVSGVGLRSTARADEGKVTVKVDITDDEVEVLWLEADPQDEQKFIVVTPQDKSAKAAPAVRVESDGRYYLFTPDVKEGKAAYRVQVDPAQKGRYVFTPDVKEGKATYRVEVDPTQRGRFVIAKPEDGDVRVWAYTQDGGDKKAVIAQGKAEGRRVQTVDLGDGKKLIIIIEDSGAGAKTTEKKDALKQVIERKIEVAKPRVVKPEVKVFTKPDPDKSKGQAEEAIKRAMDALKKASDSKDVDAARKALEDALKSLEKQKTDLFKKSEGVKKEIEELQRRHEPLIRARVLDGQKEVEAAVKKAEEALRQKELPDEIRKKLEGFKALQGEKAQGEYKKAMEAFEKSLKLTQDKVKEKSAEAEKQALEAQRKAREATARFRTERLTKPSGVRLGVSLSEPGEVLVAQLDLGGERGLVIDSVVPDSPAAKAGLQAHDVLVEFAGKPVSRNVEAFVKTVQDLKPGTTIEVVVLRKGKRTAVKGITLAEAGGDDAKFQYRLVPAERLEFKLVDPKEADFKKVIELNDADLRKLKEAKFEFDKVKDFQKLDLERVKDLDKLKELEKAKIELKLKDLDLSKAKFDVDVVKPLEKIKFDKIEIPARVKEIELDKDVLKPIKPGDKLIEIKEVDFVKPKRIDPVEKPKSGKVELLNPSIELKEIVIAPSTTPLLKGTLVGAPEVNLDEVVKVRADGSKTISISCTRNNDKFTTKYKEDKLTIEIKGTIADGKAKANELIVKDGDTEHKHAEVDKFPEQYRAKLKELLEMSAKGKFEVKSEVKD